jgi:hypothetical protein
MRSILLALLLLAATAAPAFADYFVYCDNGRISVDGRDANQMRIARGSNACQLGPRFSSRSGAQDFARRTLGGEGRSCSCR